MTILKDPLPHGKEDDSIRPQRRWLQALVAVMVVGALIFVGTAGDAEDTASSNSATDSALADWEIVEMQRQDEMTACQDEMLYWLDQMLAGGDTGFQSVVYEFGTQSVEYQFLVSLVPDTMRTMSAYGRDAAFNEVVWPALQEFCWIPVD